MLGTGLGALFARHLAPGAIAVAAAGLLLHAWRMYDKHRLERGSDAVSDALRRAPLRICWDLLMLVVGYLALRALT